MSKTLREQCEAIVDDVIDAWANEDEKEAIDILERLAVQYARERVRSCFEICSMDPPDERKLYMLYSGQRQCGELYYVREEAEAALDRLVAAVVPGDPAAAPEGDEP